jgi:hypothetical protein
VIAWDVVGGGVRGAAFCGAQAAAITGLVLAASVQAVLDGLVGGSGEGAEHPSLGSELGNGGKLCTVGTVEASATGGGGELLVLVCKVEVYLEEGHSFVSNGFGSAIHGMRWQTSNMPVSNTRL